MSKEGDKLLYHPEVLKVIRAIVRKLDDPENAVGHTVAEAFASTRTDPPEDIERWKAVVRPIAERFVIKQMKKKATRVKHGEGADVQPDDVAAPNAPGWVEGLDVEELIRGVNELARQGKVPKDWLVIIEARLAEVQSDAVAAERGISGTAHRSQTSRMFKTIGATFGATLLAAAALYATARPPDHIVTVHVPVYMDAGGAVPVPTPVPSGPPPSVLVDTDERAATVKEALLRDVDDAIRKKDWKRCVEDLQAVPQDLAHMKSKVETQRSQCDEELLRIMNSKAPPR